MSIHLLTIYCPTDADGISDPIDEAPSGFHYVGEAAKTFEGMPTIFETHSKKGPNGQGLNQFETYEDYYFVISPENWMCCVYGCINRHPDKPLS